MAETTLDSASLPIAGQSESSEHAIADQEVPPEQSFRFLDLPKELRIMIYEELMDNWKTELKFTQPKGFQIETVYIDTMHYPSLLRVNKLVGDEYQSLCLQDATLWITYGIPELASYASDEEDDDDDEDEDPAIPLLSEWLKMPMEALVKVTGVIFQFQAKWELPRSNPFSGIADCTTELPNLDFLGIWSEIDMSLIDFPQRQADRDILFKMLIYSIFDEELALDNIQEQLDREFLTRVECSLYTPLYEMNKKFRWPRRRHLAQGIAPLAGLPKWGYSKFRVVPPWCRPLDDTFMFHGEEVSFEHVEYKMPFPERIDDYDRCSEYSYDFNDDSDWATSIAGRV